MKKLVITEKTKVIKNEVENYHKLLAKYRKQRSRLITKENDLKSKMNGLDYFTQKEEYEQAQNDYTKNKKALTKISFYIKTCEDYRKAWLELYAFNLLKDNKDIITRPLYYKKEQERLFEYFDFKGLEFVVYKREWLAYNQGLYMYDNDDSRYDKHELLNDEWLEDLTLIPDNLRYRWQNRYLHFENFEQFIKDKYKQIIKIAKKSKKYIDEIEEEREKLGDHFKYAVGRLGLDYAKDWQKHGEF